MRHTEFTFRGTGGLELYGQSWSPDAPPRAVLAIVHGIGEHSGRYMNVVDDFVPRGYAVYGFDHRGHGRSPGQRGHITRWEEYRGDVEAFLRVAGEREPARPLFLWGHSLGALIALDFVMHHPEGLRGVVVTGAPLEPVGVAKPYLVAIVRLLSSIWPRFTLRTRLDVSALSRDPDVGRAYTADPLVHGLGTVRFGAESLRAIAAVKAAPDRIRLPIFLLHGGADRLNAPTGTRRFFEALTIADKALRIYPEAYHELHNDLNKAEVLRDIAQWLETRAQPSVAQPR